MSDHFFYSCIIAFIVGVGLGTYFDIDTVYIWWALLVGWSISLMALRTHADGRTGVVLAGLMFVLCGVGVLHATHSASSRSFLEQQIGTEVVLTGVVMREPEQRERSMHVYLETEHARVLAYADRQSDVSYGDQLEVIGVLERPESFRTDMGRTFNYPGFLESKGVTYVFYYPKLTVLSSGHGVKLFGFLYAIKDAFRAKVQEVLPMPQAALGEGLLLGVNGVLGKDWETIFRTTGIIHIVVLSGYNIMLVVLFVQYVLSYVLPYRSRLIFGFGAVVLFAILVGLSATVVRASIMVGLLLLLRSVGNTYNVLRGLMLAGVGMLIWNPLLLLYDPGFQLSFLATFGLILLSPHLEALVRFVPTVLGVREFLVATLATQLFVLPLLLYQIGELSVVAVLVNVLVLPMVPVAMLLTFLAGLAGFVFEPAALMVGGLAHIALTYILRVAVLFASVPFAAFVVPAFPLWVMVLGYGVLGCVLYMLVQKPKQGHFVSGWTIEEEEVVRQRILAASESDAASTKKPVFFQ